MLRASFFNDTLLPVICKYIYFAALPMSALSVAFCLSVCLSILCLRFSRNWKAKETSNLMET